MDSCTPLSPVLGVAPGWSQRLTRRELARDQAWRRASVRLCPQDRQPRDPVCRYPRRYSLSHGLVRPPEVKDRPLGDVEVAGERREFAELVGHDEILCALHHLLGCSLAAGRAAAMLASDLPVTLDVMPAECFGRPFLSVRVGQAQDDACGERVEDAAAQIATVEGPRARNVLQGRNNDGAFRP